MQSRHCSKYLLKKLLEGFNPKDLPNNQVYLEERIKQLSLAAVNFNNQASNPNVPARLRARARDMEQNATGLINGIKFGISFMLHAKDDLLLKEFGMSESEWLKNNKPQAQE